MSANRLGEAAIPMDTALPGCRSPRTAATLAIATVGLGLNLRAWILLGPRLAQRADVGLARYALLVGLPLLVAVLVRIPAGVLTDRYGARVMFPAISAVAAVCAFALGLTDSLPVLIVAGAVSGVAGAAFVVGASLIAKTVPYGGRGLALGVFSLGPAVAVGLSTVFWVFDPVGRRAALLLGVLLVGFAAVAALALQDQINGYRHGSLIRRCAEMVRLASTTSLSLLYALALGGMVAIAVYLPAYLTAVFGLRWLPALAVTGVVVGLAALARLVGGWWTDRRPTARMLVFCYAIAAVLCLAVALAPERWWLTASLIAAIAVCDGAASGALLALIGKAARTDSVGAVMGMSGAAAAFGALGLPLLLAGVAYVSRSYAPAWLLHGAILLAVALYVRARGLKIGLGLAVRVEPPPSPTAMTVAVVGESDTRWGAAAVVARLAELAASDELVVVYGSDEPTRPWPATNVLVTGLRDRLPRHSVVAVHVGPGTGSLGRHAALFGEFVESGTVAIAVTPTGDLVGVTAELSSYLRADRVLQVSYTRAAGSHLRNLWDRG